MKTPLRSKKIVYQFELTSARRKVHYKILILGTSLNRLLYAVFVVSSENSTVAELATTLQVQLSQLQAAASFACRLAWAVKLIDPGSMLQEPTSPKNVVSDDDEASRTSVGSLNMSVDSTVFDQDSSDNSGYTRVAFVVDANITSYLMMGSVSPGKFIPHQMF